MHSLSKTVLSLDTARSLITAAFGSRAVIGDFQELTDGFFNAAYQVGLTTGERYVLKVAPPASVRVLRYEQDIMHAEVASLQLVRRTTSVPVPTIYRFDDSRQLLGVPYFIMQCLPGISLHTARPGFTPQEQEAIDTEIGGYLRQINANAGPDFGYLAPTARRYSTWKAAFIAMADDVLADGADIGVTLPLADARLRELIVQSAAVLDAVGTPQLVHWDLWDGNIFIDPASRQVTGIIDFERALWGDPLMEFQFRTFEELPGFQAGYGRAMLVTRGQRLRRALYSIYLYLIMIIECYYREFETPDQENWARAQLDHELVRLAALVAEGDR